MRFVDIDGAPKRCTILKIMTNQGICGYGEVRDASSKTYALMLKSRILGENPCIIIDHIESLCKPSFSQNEGFVALQPVVVFFHICLC